MMRHEMRENLSKEEECLNSSLYAIEDQLFPPYLKFHYLPGGP